MYERTDIDKRVIQIPEHERDGVMVTAHSRRIGPDKGDGLDWKTVGFGIAAAALAIPGYRALRAVNNIQFRIPPLDMPPVARRNPVQARDPGWHEWSRALVDHDFHLLNSLDSGASITSDVVFDPRAYQHLQGRNYPETLRNVERAIKGRPVEHGFMIDEGNGTILAAFRGRQNEVATTVPTEHLLADLSDMRNVVFTHNHPYHTPLSPDDVRSLLGQRINGVRAVEPDGNVTMFRADQRAIYSRSQEEAVAISGDFIEMATKQVNWLETNAKRAGVWGDLQRGEFSPAVIRFFDNNQAYRREYTSGYQRMADRHSHLFSFEQLGRVVKMISKHLRGEHDQKKHDPTKGKGSRSHRAEGLQQAASGAPGWLNPDTVDAAIYGAIGGGSAALARHYMTRNRVLATAYGVYALGSLAAGGTSLHSGLSKAAKTNPLKMVVDALTQITGVDDETLIEDLGEFIIDNEIGPDEIDEELIGEFIESYNGVGDVGKADSYADGMDDITLTGDIAKVDKEHRQVFGWASVTERNGEPVVDLQKDYIGTDDLEQAAYDYVLDSRVGGEMHQRVGKSSPKHVATLIESFVVTPEKVEKLGLPPGSLPNGWWIGFQIPKDETGDQIWGDVKKGKYAGFSIHGVGKRLKKNRSEIGKGVMTRSKPEYKAWLKRMSEVSGITPEAIDADLKEWISSEGLQDPSDDDVHDFLTTAYGDDQGHEVEKHLIGRHNQKKHDPTKGSDHSRSDHSTASGAAVGGAAAGGATAAATRATTSAPLWGAMTPGSRFGPAAAVGGLGALAGGAIGARRGASGRDQAVQQVGQQSQGQDEAGTLQQLSNESGIPVQQLQAFAQQTGQDATRMYMDWQKMRDRGSLQDMREVGGKMGQQAQNQANLHRQHAQQAETHDDQKIRKALYAKAAEYAETTEEFWEYVGEVQKHLIGRHEQKDHDPTKGKSTRGFHSRDDHQGIMRSGRKAQRRNEYKFHGGDLVDPDNFRSPEGLQREKESLVARMKEAQERGKSTKPYENALEMVEESSNAAWMKDGSGHPEFGADIDAPGINLGHVTGEEVDQIMRSEALADRAKQLEGGSRRKLLEEMEAFADHLDEQERRQVGKNQPKKPGWETKWYPKRPRRKPVDPNKIYNERRHQRRKLNKRALTDREREVLAKYLGR